MPQLRLDEYLKLNWVFAMTISRQTNSRHCSLRSAVIVILAALACAFWLQANRVQAQNDLSVTVSFNSQTPLTPDTPIELHLNRALKTNEGRIAVIIDHTDVSSLFVVNGARLVYVPTLMPLPLGATQVGVYLVDNGGAWREVARFDLRVVKEKPVPNSTPAPAIAPPDETKTNTTEANTRANGDGEATSTTSLVTNNGTPASLKKPGPEATPSPSPSPAKPGRFGFEKMDFVPSVTIAVKSQVLQLNFPADSRPATRATFNDVTLQFSLRTESKRGPFSAQTQFDFAGSSFQQEALRFGSLGNTAPQIDLSSYLTQFQLGRAKFALGHTSFGSSRQLVNSFSSRGLTITVPITKRFDFSVAAMNGTNVVGYGNFFGLAKSKHQLQSATLGVELLPKRPGGLRLEFSGMNAYIQALNSFSQGAVNDVERSKGGSVRLIATDKTGRFKFDGGFARSQYRNPADPLLYQGTNTVAVPFLTRNARYFDVSFDVLRSYALTKTKQVSLNLAMRHEQVDPLYKSLGASAQADKQQNDFQMSGNIGEITFQAGHGRFNDNLRHIASILQSLTRSKQFSVALPAAALWGGTSSTSEFLPRLAYSWSQTHQFGAAIPVNGGFETDPGSVPNQFSTSQNFTADWQIKKVTVGYNYNRSFTNNEQTSRKQSDFLNQTNSARVGFNPTSKLTLTFDVSRDSASDLEGAKLQRTWRVGTTASWNVNKHMTWTGGISNTIAGDRAQTSGSRNTEFDTQFSYRVEISRGDFKKVQGQFFVRYADRYARSHDLLFGITNLTRVKIVNAGLNITFF
jgi:hypothetical protein